LEMPQDQAGARTTWSQPMQRLTVKFLGAVSGNGAFTFASGAFPGRLTGPEVTKASGFIDVVHAYGKTSADKSSAMLYAEFRGYRHELLVPAVIQAGQIAFTSGQRRESAIIARVRKQAKRAFGRAQKFKILRRPVPINEVDLYGKIFRVCCYLCNFQPPVFADKVAHPDGADAKCEETPKSPASKRNKN